MVVDFQHHYVPVELAKKRGLYSDKTTYLQEGGRRATTMHARLYDLDLQLKDMREGGIDVSVLSCLLGWNASLDECRLINDDLSRVQGKYTGKFVGLAQAPILDGKEALQEIDRAIRSLGLKGITITSQIKGVSLDSPKLYDLYEKVCELDVPIFVHPALVPIGYELLQDYDLPRVLGREVDLCVATTRLIAGGILDRFPKLKLVIAHFGGGNCSCEGPTYRQGLSLRYAQTLICELLRNALFRSRRIRRRAAGFALCAAGHPARTTRFRQRLSAGFYGREY